jgi:hypothetical protein
MPAPSPSGVGFLKKVYELLDFAHSCKKFANDFFVCAVEGSKQMQL